MNRNRGSGRLPSGLERWLIWLLALGAVASLVRAVWLWLVG